MLKSTRKPTSSTENAHDRDVVRGYDAQLLIELEMDAEVKDIITFPEKYENTFLDVTVIKPNMNQLCATEKKIMSGEQVKQFIASMNLEKNKEFVALTKHQVNRISAGDFAVNSKQEAVDDKMRYQYAIGDHSRLPLSSDDSIAESDRVQQVFTAPKTFATLSSLFQCSNRTRDVNEKNRCPCICRNCATMGIVTDSQKKPFSTEPSRDPAEYSRHSSDETNKKRRQSYSKEDHHQCHYYFKHLNDKIRVLEERVAQQEQRAVPREYFKKIVTKLLNHIGKVTGYGGQIKIETCNPTTATKKTRQSSLDADGRYEQMPHQKFTVNPISVHDEKQLKDSVEQELSNMNTNLWKWGEDILKPGIDLKNKIISVMEVTLNNLKKTREKPKDEELKHFIHDFSNNLYKTINDESRAEKSHRVDLNATSDFNERNNKSRQLNRKLGLNLDDPVSVTYVNSHVLKWQDTQTTFKFESDKDSTNNVLDKKRTQDLHRHEFVKTIKNTKEEDKRRLWQSIWDQASKNGHCKNNKVTVQIPDKKNPKNKTVEVEYTLGELEYLLLGTKTGRS